MLQGGALGVFFFQKKSKVTKNHKMIGNDSNRTQKCELTHSQVKLDFFRKKNPSEILQKLFGKRNDKIRVLPPPPLSLL